MRLLFFRKDRPNSLTDKPQTHCRYHTLYTVDRLNNMAGGVPIRYVNLPSSELAKYCEMLD